MTTTDTPAAQAADPTTDAPQAAAVEPFEAGFDYDDNYCSSGVDFVREELAEHPDIPAELATRLDTELAELTDEAAMHRLRDLADELEEASSADDEDDDEDEPDPFAEDGDADDTPAIDPYETAQALRDLSDHLDFCTDGCCCAWDAYSGWGEDYLDRTLAELGDHVWAVVEHRGRHEEPLKDINDVLDMGALIFRADLQGWSQVTLAWDGTALTADFSGYHGSTHLVLHPLTAEQADLWGFWDDRDYEDNLAARVRATDPAVLRQARHLWVAVGQDELPLGVSYLPGEFGDLVAAVAEVGTEVTAGIDPAVLTRLEDGWTSSLTDLLRISAQLSEPAPAPAG